MPLNILLVSEVKVKPKCFPKLTKLHILNIRLKISDGEYLLCPFLTMEGLFTSWWEDKGAGEQLTVAEKS